jgi:hypothetical protein
LIGIGAGMASSNAYFPKFPYDFDTPASGSWKHCLWQTIFLGWGRDRTGA